MNFLSKRQWILALIAILLSFCMGMLAGELYYRGYVTGQHHPRYIVHETSSTIYFEYPEYAD